MVDNKVDEIYLKRCIELAKMGIRNAAPNPMVGSVIVCEGKVIGEGYHQKCGEAHAEVNAVNSVKDKSLLKKSTIYVSLEPCAHYGKTPPCAELIVKHQIPRVVIGIQDPFAKVAGKGIQILKDGGCEVTVGVLEQECRELNRRFFTFHEQKRPYIILKWAQTLDGFIDIDREKADFGQPTWITNDLAKMVVHKWRTEEQGIMVGTKTAAKDNPHLNVREWTGNNPTRIVLDENLDLPESLNLFNGEIPTLVFTQRQAENRTNIEYISIDFKTNIISQILKELHDREIQSVIVEGGEQVLTSFINQNLWDEARVFIGNKFFYDGVKAPKLKAKLVTEDTLGDSKLFVYRNLSILETS